MFFNKINIRYKSSLAISFLLIDLLLTLYHFVNLANSDIDFASNEKTGIKVISPLYNVINPLIQYQIAYFQPNLLSSEQIHILEQKIEDSLDTLNTIDKSSLKNIHLTPDLLPQESKESLDISKLSQQWQIVKNNFYNHSADNQFLYKNRALQNNLLALISYVGDKSNLILDPALDSYYLMNILVKRMSSLYTALDKISNNALKASNIVPSPENPNFLKKEYNNLVYSLKSFNSDIINNEFLTVITENNNSYGVSDSLKKTLPSVKINFRNASNDLYLYLNNLEETPKYNSKEFNSKFFDYLSTLDSTILICATELDKLLDIRMDYFKSNKNTVTYINLVGILISFITSYLIINLFIVNPINKLCLAMQKLIQGSVDVDIPYLNNEDEIGYIANTINKFKQSLKENSSLIEQDRLKEIEKIIHIEKEHNMEAAVSTFRTQFSEMMSLLEGKATSLNNTSKNLEDTVNIANTKSTNTLSESLTISENTKSVTTLISNVAKTINNINQQVLKSKNVINSSVNQTENIDKTVANLNNQTNEINHVLELINKISHQIHLLALNANIEATRAGEHGKGFAVVASEVKLLANQSASAAETIHAKISNIESSNIEVSEALMKLKAYIKDINVSFTTISEAITEQNQATENISQKMNNVSNSVNSVTSNMKDVQNSFEHVKVSTNSLIKYIDPITNIISSLYSQLDSFITQIYKISNSDKNTQVDSSKKIL
jgi:methyl-accepting chemotaxis protein